MRTHPNLRWFEMDPELAYYQDSGHGWLAVSLTRYPTAAEFASSFSFFIGHGDERWTLIEEDVDAGRFLRAHPAVDGSKIRSVHISDADGELLRRLPRGDRE